MIVLPAATSEYVDIPVTSVTDPQTLDWETAMSTTSTTSGHPAPDDNWSSTVVDDNGATVRPRYTVRFPIDGLAAGVYGMWLRVLGDPYASPVRFVGRLRLY